MERNVSDITSLGFSEAEILTFDVEEQKQLAKTARQLMKAAQKMQQPHQAAMGAAAGV